MLVEAYTIPPSAEYPLFVTAKRYWTPESEANGGADPAAAHTLIVLHSTSFHKETWESTLDELFALADAGSRRNHIRDVWAIECPNHGESALLNHRALSQPQFANDFSCQRYAQAVHRFLTSVAVDFRSRNLIGIGHSLGANAMLLLQHIQPTFDFTCLVIVEPMVSAQGPQHVAKLREALVAGAQRRQHTWPTLNEARKTYRTHNKLAKWDRRVTEAFMDHGMHWVPEKNEYMLCCSRQQEIAMYNDVEGPTKPVEVLDAICHTIPIHLILGEIADYIPRHVHRALVNPASGRAFASITTMSGVGHLIPQERPTELASHLFAILGSRSSPSRTSSSKL